MTPGVFSPGGWRLSARDGFRVWAFLAVAYLGVSAFFLMGLPPWGDEGHFIETVRFFGAVPWTEAALDYPQVMSPLSFMLYALWGKAFGFGLITLRIFTLLLALGALLALHRFVSLYLHRPGEVLLVCAALLLNPYLAGLGVFVFTDMPALLFVLLAFLLFGKERFAGASLALAAAMLCRQYAVIFWAALAGAATWGAIASSRRGFWIRALVLLGAAPLPLMGLMLAWGGMAPPAGRTLWFVGDAPPWNPHAFTVYVATLAVYLVPLLLWRARLFRENARLLWVAVPAGLVFYAAFPVKASLVAFLLGAPDTVGFFHKAVRILVGTGLREHAILAGAFCLGLWLVLVLVRDDMRLWGRGDPHPAAVLSLAVYLFVLVMPMSPQVWEKYLVLILPMAAARMALLPPVRPIR